LARIEDIRRRFDFSSYEIRKRTSITIEIHTPGRYFRLPVVYNYSRY